MNMYDAAMTANLYRINSFRPGRETPFVGGLKLAAGRAHEFCGPSRRTLALMLAGCLAGPVLWISSGRRKTRLNADGVLAHVNPGRLVMVSPPSERDVLWSMEEALRSGAAGLVVADLSELPAMVPVRRLHLAAETGTGGGLASAGVILTADDGGAQGIESRWHMSPRHMSGAMRWRLERRLVRGAAPVAWDLVREPSGLRLSAAQCRAEPHQGWDDLARRMAADSGDVVQFPAREPAGQSLARVADLVN